MSSLTGSRVSVGQVYADLWDTAFRLPERNQEAEAMGEFMVEVNC